LCSIKRYALAANNIIAPNGEMCKNPAILEVPQFYFGLPNLCDPCAVLEKLRRLMFSRDLASQGSSLCSSGNLIAPRQAHSRSTASHFSTIIRRRCFAVIIAAFGRFMRHSRIQKHFNRHMYSRCMVRSGEAGMRPRRRRRVGRGRSPSREAYPPTEGRCRRQSLEWCRKGTRESPNARSSITNRKWVALSRYHERWASNS
jgi:hypothetical protein